MIAALHGLQQGLVLNLAKESETSASDAARIKTIAFLQVIQEYNALGLVRQAAKAAGHKILSWQWRAVIYLTPPLLAYIVLKEQSSLHNIALFVQAHLSALCNLAALVSSVALLFLGQVPFGMASCAMLAIGWLDQSNRLPEWLHHWLHAYSGPLSTLLSLLIGNFFYRCYAVGELISLIAVRYFEQDQASIDTAPPPTAHPLRPDQFEELSQLSVDPDYIHLPIPSNDEPAKQKLLLRLRKERLDWIRNNYREDPLFKFLQDTIAPLTGIEPSSLWTTLIGKKLGIRASHHDSSFIESILYLLFSEWYSNHVSQEFWASHEPLEIAQKSLSNEEIQSLWRAWIERQEAAPQTQETLNALCNNTSLPFTDHRSISLMLYDIGVYKELTASSPPPALSPVDESIWRPYLEGIERLRRAGLGRDGHSLQPLQTLSLKQRATSLLTGSILMIPLVNAVFWIYWKTFFHPENLSV